MIDRRAFLITGTTAMACASAADFAQGQNTHGSHIVLLGDSIFDNAAYVAGGPDVARQLRDILPSGWRATLNARDGAVIADLPQQLKTLPGDATHLVVSIGGNDALGESGLLDRKVSSMAEALELISAVRERFRSSYPPPHRTRCDPRGVLRQEGPGLDPRRRHGSCPARLAHRGGSHRDHPSGINRVAPAP